MEKIKERAIGIDLGTTYTRVAVWQSHNVDDIADELGNCITPSYVSFTETDYLVGDAAKEREIMHPCHTVYDFKRIIGRKYSEPSVQAEMRDWPFSVVPGHRGKPSIVVDMGQHKQYYPEQIASGVLLRMKILAESSLGHSVGNAVITVPSSFKTHQRKAMEKAAAMAGLNVLRTISETSAAALAYGVLIRSTIKPTNTLIFSLGGGTFEVSLSIMKRSTCEVLAKAGDPHFGGHDFDQRLQSYFVAKIWTRYRMDITTNKLAMRKLRIECEKAKRILSYSDQTTVKIDFLFDGIIVYAPITRVQFEVLSEDLFRKCIETVERVLLDANVSQTKVQDVFLIGGSSKIPKIQELLHILFHGRQAFNIMRSEIVVHGAAIQAANLSHGWIKGIPRFHLQDVTPFSLGLEFPAGTMMKVVPRNSTLPAWKRWVFSNEHAYFKRNPCLQIREGEAPLAEHNQLLGNLDLSRICAEDESSSIIRTDFDINIGGALKVSAEEMTEGTEWVKLAVMNPVEDDDNGYELEADDVENHPQEPSLDLNISFEETFNESEKDNEEWKGYLVDQPEYGNATIEVDLPQQQEEKEKERIRDVDDNKALEEFQMETYLGMDSNLESEEEVGSNSSEETSQSFEEMLLMLSTPPRKSLF